MARFDAVASPLAPGPASGGGPRRPDRGDIRRAGRPRLVRWRSVSNCTFGELPLVQFQGHTPARPTGVPAMKALPLPRPASLTTALLRATQRAVNPGPSAPIRPFDPATTFHGPMGRYTSVHYGLMLSNLPAPLNFLDVIGVVGQPKSASGAMTNSSRRPPQTRPTS